MRTLHDSRTAVALLAGLSLTGVLAGCSTTATEERSNAATETTPRATPSTTATTPAATGSYADGTYTESGSYQAPSGTETVDVTLTLANDVITAVTVTGQGTDPQSILHQGQFSSGIAAVVVGKKLDEIQVDKVGGSSLTSTGFNAAVALIKDDATQ